MALACANGISDASCRLVHAVVDGPGDFPHSCAERRSHHSGTADLALGDQVADSPDGVVSYVMVAEIAKGRALVLISHTHPLPIYRDVDFSWAFVLDDDVAGADTRLILRSRVAYTPVGPGPIIGFLVATGFGIGDIVQAGAMLGGIKARAELISA